MNPKEPKSPLKCWDCGAENDPDASECRLCHRRDWKPGAIAVSARSESSRDELPLMPGDQARKAVMTDDIVAMISQHRRERASAPGAREPRWWSVLWSWLRGIVSTVWESGRRDQPRPMHEQAFWVLIVPWILLPALVLILPVALGIALIICCIRGTGFLIIMGLVVALGIALIICCAMFGLFVHSE